MLKIFKRISIVATGLIFSCFFSCREKSQNEIVFLKVPDIYFKYDDGVYTNNNGVFLRNGKMLTGNLVSFFREHDSASIRPYFNGLEEGCVRKFYPNKKLAEERFYHLGKKEGTHKGWWENGQQKFIYQFKNDNHEGIAQTWYADGKPATENFYEKGYEVGLQRAWYSDGVLRANYEARNGRQYGLTGVKNCASVYDSITNKFVEKNTKKQKIKIAN